MIEVFPPMKYASQPKDWDKIQQDCESHQFIAQEKVDGQLCQLFKDSNGIIHAYGRTVSRVTGGLLDKADHIPHIVSWMEQDKIPNETIIVGELYYPGGTSKSVTPIMGSKTEKAISRQEGEYGWLHFYAFDLIAYDGNDLRPIGFEQRYSELCAHIDVDADNNEYVKVASSMTGFDLFDKIEEVLRDPCREGVVLKKKNYPYLSEKRPKAAGYKIKQIIDPVDMVITSIIDSSIDYTGQHIDSWEYWIDSCGSLHHDKDGYKKGFTPVNRLFYYNYPAAIGIGGYDSLGNLVQTGTVSGLTDYQREQLRDNPKDYVGKVISIQAMSKDFNEKSLRHPRIVDFIREDKPATDCLLEEIFS